jgi:hypothetical protein
MRLYIILVFMSSKHNACIHERTKQEVLGRTIRLLFFHCNFDFVSDTTSRKETSACTRNEVNKTIQFGRLQCWYY